MKHNKIEYIRGDKSLLEKFRKTAVLLQKFNSGFYDTDVQKREFFHELFGSAGENIVVEHNFHCDFGYNIHVGNNFYAGFNCTILDMAEVRIGDNCMIAPNVGLYTAGHNIHPADRYKTGYAIPITIGNNVWIGGHCAIIGGVTIGDNSVIAAGSVLIRDVPANTVFGGNPARKIKEIPPKPEKLVRFCRNTPKS